MKNMVFCFVVGIAAGLCGTAEAGFIASFTENGDPFAPAPINVGDTVTVPLFLRFVDSPVNPGVNYLVAPGGIMSLGIRVMFGPGIVSGESGSIVSGLPGPPISFDNVMGMAVIQGVAPPKTLVSIPPGSLSLQIGELVFRGLAGGVSVLKLSDLDDLRVNTIGRIGPDDPEVPLDNEINFAAGVGSIIVNRPNTGVVPEPTSLALLCAGMIALVFPRACRRRFGPGNVSA